MIKQIAMVAMLGLALVLATATVYTQSAQAIRVPVGDNGPPTTANGLATACAANTNVATHNPNC